MICVTLLALVPPIALCWMVLLALTAGPSRKKAAVKGVWLQAILSAPLLTGSAFQINNEELLMPVFAALSLVGVISGVLAAKVHQAVLRPDVD